MIRFCIKWKVGKKILSCRWVVGSNSIWSSGFFLKFPFDAKTYHVVRSKLHQISSVLVQCPVIIIIIRTSFCFVFQQNAQKPGISFLLSFKCKIHTQKRKGSRDGAVVEHLPPMQASHQCGPGFDSRTQRHMWVEFVVGSLLCSKRFFSGFSGFPLSSKTNTSKFQFDLESVPD